MRIQEAIFLISKFDNNTFYECLLDHIIYGGDSVDYEEFLRLTKVDLRRIKKIEEENKQKIINQINELIKLNK